MARASRRRDEQQQLRRFCQQHGLRRIDASRCIRMAKLAMHVPETRGEGHGPFILAMEASHALHVPFFSHFLHDLSKGLLAGAGVHDGAVFPVP